MSAVTSRAWVDFRALRSQLDFRKVLAHYGVKYKEKPGVQVLCFCPLPTHRGKRRSASFSINLEKGIWQCFGCGSKGNVLDLAARMDGLDPFRGVNIRTTALKLMEVFGVSSASCSKTPATVNSKTSRSAGPEAPKPADRSDGAAPSDSIVVNAPLDFALKDLDQQHPYLSGRGFTEETIAHFGVGFCNRGMLRGRIAIPIRDERGQLIAYAGRVIDDRAVTETNPKYKLPPGREHDGKRYEFHKSLLVYNLESVPRKVTDLIVVEGFPSTWWLWQHGYRNVGCLMGNDCSVEQSKLILERVEIDGRVWIMSDGDRAGERCAYSVFEQIAAYRFCRWVRLKDGEQPTDCSAEELAAMLSV